MTASPRVRSASAARTAGAAGADGARRIGGEYCFRPIRCSRIRDG
jgi:hypothetical protein